MSVILNIADNDYIGTLKAAADIENGIFVTSNFAAGTAAAAVDDAAGDASGLMIVCNVNENIDEQGVADDSFVIKTGRYLRLKAFEVGDIFTSDKFKGTYGSLNVSDKFAVGDGGTVEAVAARTPKLLFEIIEKTTLFGNSALKLRVLSV